MSEQNIQKFTIPLNEVVDGAVGPFGPYCMGYMNPGASGSGYIATMKLSTGTVNMADLDTGTEGIVSYDRCEKNDAYIGQINMLTASSFCGINGALWGYHLAKADKSKRIFSDLEIPVYPVAPLLDATERLFGRVGQRRFPPMPGAHVVCANKSVTAKGPCWVWSAIAVAIAKDRNQDANLFIEDADQFDYPEADKKTVQKELEKRDENIVKSIILCAEDQKVEFKEIYVGHKYQYVQQNEVGCALTCAPYVLLAGEAIPPGDRPSDILNMTIDEWEKALNLPPLPPLK